MEREGYDLRVHHLKREGHDLRILNVTTPWDRGQLHTRSFGGFYGALGGQLYLKSSYKTPYGCMGRGSDFGNWRVKRRSDFGFLGGEIVNWRPKLALKRGNLDKTQSSCNSVGQRGTIITPHRHTKNPDKNKRVRESTLGSSNCN